MFMTSGMHQTAVHVRDLPALEKAVVGCRRCERLVAWRQKVARQKVARFKEADYWGRPVPGFGDPGARLLIVGLAPAAHGGNRTGRMFTGDRSGDWLYRALHKFGFSNLPTSVSRDDGVVLTDCFITASARCAPPQNKLLREELENCRPFLLAELALLKNVRVIVALGKVGFDSALNAIRRNGGAWSGERPIFGHGREFRLKAGKVLIASFHPSQQNTFTGRLTEPMFDAVFRRAREILKSETK